MTFPQQTEQNPSGVGWTRGVAVSSLVVGALLLLGGKRRPGLIAAAVGTAVALLERPGAVRDFWNALPGYVQATQDVLGRTETFVDELHRQGDHLRTVIAREP
jgi:uncharacterized membrane protein YphA (DoxX/SURF4 family)